MISNVRGEGRGRLTATLAAVLAATAGFGGLPRGAAGQVVIGGRAQQAEVVNVFLPAPRELRLRLTRAEEALQDERYVDAVAELGTLLKELDSGGPEGGEFAGDYFVGGRGEGGTQRSLRAEALRLLGLMPPRGIEAYELQYGAEARRMLGEALRDGDPERLTEIVRRFFHTRAGYEAAILLGRYHLSQSRPLAAALCLQRVADTPAGVQFEPELSVLLATCWMYAEMPKQSEAVLDNLKARMPQASLRVGGEPMRIFDQPHKPVVWLDRVIGPRSTSALTESQWVMHRGNASRNARVVGDSPLLNFNWFQRLQASEDDHRAVEQMSDRFLDQNAPAIPALQPLVVGDLVLLRTPWHVFGVDVQSGKLKWHYPWDVDPDRQFEGSPGFAAAGLGSPRMQQIQQRIWEDVPWGQLSSDGESVFLVDDLGALMPAQYIPNIIIAAGGIQRRNPDSPKSYNRIAALDLRQEGKLRWLVGDEEGEADPRLAGAFFLGPPLPLLKQLYLLAEINGEIRLVVLDADSGKLEWSQQLAHVDAQTILVDPLRRLAGASPSFADGVLVCPTSSGAIVAVDIATRSLLWGYQYEQAPNPYGRHFGVWQLQMYRQQNQPGTRWIDATVAIAEGRVVATPVKSDELHCLDLLTGDLLWKRPRGEGLYVGCIHDGKVLVVGKDRVTALRLADGKEAWKDRQFTAIPSSGMPSGRGFFSGEFYFLPTTQKELLKISLATGEIVQRVPTQTVLGNLVCHDGLVISQGSNLLSSYHQAEPLKDQVARRLAKNPEDAWALARQGELLLHEGRRVEAIESLRRAYRADPSSDDVQALLVQSLLESLRLDFAAHRALAAELEELIRSPEQREEFRRLMAVGLQQMGERRQAFEMYLKIAGLDDPGRDLAELPGAAAPLKQIEPHLSIRPDRWVKARLSEVYAAAGAEERPAMDAAIEAQVAAAIAADSSRALRRLCDLVGAHPAADRARLHLARRYLGAGDLLAAELLLGRLADAAEPAVAGPALAGLAEVAVAAGHHEEAALLYRRLAAEFADVECRDGKTGRQLLAEISADPGVGAALRRPGWPMGNVTVAQSGDAGLGLTAYQQMFPLDVRTEHGPVAPGVQVALEPQRSSLVIRDGWGRRVVNIPLQSQTGQNFYSSNYALSHGKLRGHLLVLCMGTEMMAVDTLQQTNNHERRDLWRVDLADALPGTAVNVVQQVQRKVIDTPWGGPRIVAADMQNRPLGTMGPLTDDTFLFLKGRRLTCLDPLSGETLWQRDDVAAGSDLWGDAELVLVAAPQSEEAVAYATLDGRQLRRLRVPEEDRRWASLGRRILTWDDQPGHRVLRLFDPWTETDDWALTVTSGSKAWLIGRDELAVMQPDGRFLLLRLEDGAVRIDAVLEPEPNLAGIYVLRSESDYVLVTNTPVADPDDTLHIQATPPGMGTPLVYGRAYAFDRATGRPLWPAPAVLERYGLPLDQPSELPTLVLLREIRKAERNQPTRPVTSALVLDRRDGRMLFAKDDIGTQARAYEMVGDAARHEAELRLPGVSFTLRFTDDPRPPEPPAQTGSASSLMVKERDVVEATAGALLRAIQRGMVPANLPGQLLPPIEQGIEIPAFNPLDSPVDQ